MFSRLSLRLPAAFLSLPRAFATSRVGVRQLSTATPPKRPSTPFVLYTMENRELTKRVTPSAKHSEIIKTLGATWRSMTDAEKKPYMDRYQTEKAKYDELFAKIPEAQKLKMKEERSAAAKKTKEEKAKKAEKETRRAELAKKHEKGMPKRSPSAYFLYLNENREAIRRANPNAKVKEIPKIAAEQFKNLPPAERKVYEDRALSLKQQYSSEMTAWKAANPTPPKPKPAKKPDAPKKTILASDAKKTATKTAKPATKTAKTTAKPATKTAKTAAPTKKTAAATKKTSSAKATTGKKPAASKTAAAKKTTSKMAAAKKPAKSSKATATPKKSAEKKKTAAEKKTTTAKK